MFTGALLVMVLAILADLVLGGITRLAQRRSAGRRRVRTDIFDVEDEPASGTKQIAVDDPIDRAGA